MMSQTFADRLEEVKASTRDYLESQVVNEEYNNFCRQWADKDEEKRIPYLGFYWRDVDFYHRYIVLGRHGDYVAFMEKNKWGYPARKATPKEFERIIALIDKAMSARRQGGIVSELEANTEAVLKELADYLQTIEIQE